VHQVDSTRAAPDVDRVHLAQEPHRLADSKLVGLVPEGTDVFGQAAATEAEPRLQEALSDAVIQAEGLRQHLDVGAGDLAHLSHGVDVGNFGGQEGVCGDLD
jgi:hypothetical protein